MYTTAHVFSWVLFLKVDSFSRTNVESIWAIGDVTNRINLTPVALMEGMAVAKTAFGNEPTKPDYRYGFSNPINFIYVNAISVRVGGLIQPHSVYEVLYNFVCVVSRLKWSHP